MGEGVVDHQLPQAGVGHAELGVGAQLALAADFRQVFRVVEKGLAMGGDDAVVGVAAVQVESLGHAIARAPVGVGLVVEQYGT